MKNVLVTGGSGFIGSHLVDALLAAGYRTANVDTAAPLLDAQRPLWIECDILDKEKLAGCVERVQPEFVIHLAARADISSTDWSNYTSIYEGTRNLLDALAACPSVRRLVNTSTQLVVGPGHFPTSDEDFHPYTTYGEAKALAERELRKRDPNIVWLTIRPTNIWGPRHPHFAKSIWLYLARRFYLHPNVGAPIIRSYGYVRNTADQIVGLMTADAEKVHRKVFYVADGNIDSARWLDEFSMRFNRKKTRRFPVRALRGIALIGDAMRQLKLSPPLDSGRLLRMTTNYEVPLEPTFDLVGTPRISMEVGVRETVEWLKSYDPARFGGVSA